ncbi:hypothetical protein ACFTAO_38660 [Paenibacillus rhizoplanae]
MNTIRAEAPREKGDAAGTEHPTPVFDEFEAKRTDEYRRSCQYNRHADHRKPIQDFKKTLPLGNPPFQAIIQRILMIFQSNESGT